MTQRQSIGFHIALVIAALLLVGRPAGAGAAATPLVGYSASSWSETEGAPLGAVNALVQDADGYL